MAVKEMSSPPPRVGSAEGTQIAQTNETATCRREEGLVETRIRTASFMAAIVSD